jgi:polyferredoxin
MHKRPGKITNYYRISLQWVVLALLAYMVIRPFLDKNYGADYESYCPFGGMQALASFFSSNTLTCSMTTVQIAMGLALFLGVILLSKLFCSYICPIGTVTEWIGSRARKLKLQVTLKGWPDKLFRVFKYSLLFVTFYFSVSSSELFCRKFDPYFASFTGFSGDVVLLYALPALILTIAGSFFIRQFWCKYLCPLGAITNLAVYALPIAAISLLWVILNSILSLDISWVWLLGTICLAGFLLEATTLRFLIFPPLRVSRNKDICTNCRICDKKCPMAVPISTVDKVNHIDCHLCTDCIVKCPEKGALSINKRSMTWLPAVATLILIVAAMIISTAYELPTISERWTDSQSLKAAGVVEMSGLKNIKCFGSSRSFANQMKEVPGVLGVETYVKHHKVKVYYDKKITDQEKIKAAIFNPVAEFMSPPERSLERISVVTLGIDHCFDPNDQRLLTELMRKQKGLLAMETAFGEPVKAIFYYDSTLTNPAEIESRINQKSALIGEGPEQEQVEIDFAVNKRDFSTAVLSKEEFLGRFFESSDVKFNKYESFSLSELKEFRITFPEAMDPGMQEWIPYLVSHMSNDDGIVRFKTAFTNTDPELKLWYVTKLTTPEKIRTLLNEPMFLVHYPDKSVERVKNPFRFKDIGK